MFLRRLSRNAARFTTRWRSLSTATRHILTSSPPAYISGGVVSVPRERLVCSARMNLSRGFAQGAEAEAEPRGGVVEGAEDGADEEISLAYTLTAEELDKADQLLRRIIDSRSRDSPIRITAEWIEEGNKLTEPILLKVFRKLRASEHHAVQAYKLMLWVLREKKLPATEKVYLMAIMGAQTARKVLNARAIYNYIPVAERTTAISTAMVEAYARTLDPKNAESILAAFTPKTAQAYNSLIRMYVILQEYGKAKEVYERLRKAGMRPNKVTFLTLAKHKKELGIEVDKAEAEAILDENMDELESNKRAWYAAKNAMLAYAYMGDAEGVEKMWSRLEKVDGLPTYFWSMGVEAFGCIGRIEKLEEIVDKVPQSRRREETFYPAVIRGYVMNNLMDKAEAVVSRIRAGEEETKLTYRLYDELIQGYMERKDSTKPMEKMKEARESITVRRTRPSYYIVKMLLPLYAKAKDISGAEELVKLTAPRVEPLVYNKLLSVYISARKKPSYDFLERMQKSRVKPDGETKRLLKKTEEYGEIPAAA